MTTVTWGSMTQAEGKAAPTQRSANLGDGNAMGSLVAAAIAAQTNPAAAATLALNNLPTKNNGRGGIQ